MPFKKLQESCLEAIERLQTDYRLSDIAEGKAKHDEILLDLNGAIVLE